MTEVIFSPEAYADLERLEDFLWTTQDPLAAELLDFLFDGLMVLTHQPGIGRPMPHGHRELIISRGRGGYLARYTFDPARLRVIVLGIRHQREAGDHNDEI
jgi:plasmid stabilization system protein ParE